MSKASDFPKRSNQLDYVTQIVERFRSNAHPQQAGPMKKYMKDRYAFFGIKAPERRILQREFLTKKQLPDRLELESIVHQLWEMPERELQYFAQELVGKFVNKLEPGDIELLEYLITNNSWWDTVDYIASCLVGPHFKRYPQQIKPYTEKWLESGHMWLQRTAILFQLKYREEIDLDLLFHCIDQLSHSKEFFLRKAIGWALRQHSKVEPDVVLKFVTQPRTFTTEPARSFENNRKEPEVKSNQ